MKLSVVLLVCSCVGVFELCGMSGASLEAQTTNAAKSSKISTTLSLHGSQFTIGQEVIATLTIKNILNQSIPFRTIPHSYHVYVEGANGKEVEMTRFHHRLRGDFLPGESDLALGGVTLELQPGKTGAKDFDLTKYYRLQEAGTYRVYIDCHETGTWVRSNIVSFELKEPN